MCKFPDRLIYFGNQIEGVINSQLEEGLGARGKELTVKIACVTVGRDDERVF